MKESPSHKKVNDYLLTFCYNDLPCSEKFRRGLNLAQGKKCTFKVDLVLRSWKTIKFGAAERNLNLARI